MKLKELETRGEAASEPMIVLVSPNARIRVDNVLLYSKHQIRHSWYYRYNKDAVESWSV